MNSLCKHLPCSNPQAVRKYLAVAFTALFIFFFINRIDSDYPRAVLSRIKDISPIPDSVHFVYILQDPGKDLVFPFQSFLCVFSAEHHWQPAKIYLHTNAEPAVLHRARVGESGKWSRLIFNMPNLHVVSVDTPTVAGNGLKIERIEHKSDFVRVEAVRRFGGTYLDFDAFALRDIRVLRNSGFNAVCGLCVTREVISGTFMSKKGSKLIEGWAKMMHEIFDGGWTTHSNGLVHKLANQLVPDAGEAIIMEPNAFAPGSWEPEDITRMFQIHNDTPSSLPDNYRELLMYDMETPDTEPPGWAIDYSSTYILHAFKPVRLGEAAHGFAGITPRYVLQKQSNFARAIYPAALAMVRRGFISEEDLIPEAAKQT